MMRHNMAATRKALAMRKALERKMNGNGVSHYPGQRPQRRRPAARQPIGRYPVDRPGIGAWLPGRKPIRPSQIKPAPGGRIIRKPGVVGVKFGANKNVKRFPSRGPVKRIPGLRPR